MELGMIGLGRMGGNMATRLREAGHDVKTYDPGVESTASTLAELRDQLDRAACVLADGAGRRDHRVDVPGGARASPRPGDIDRRRRQLELPRLAAP